MISESMPVHTPRSLPAGLVLAFGVGAICAALLLAFLYGAQYFKLLPGIDQANAVQGPLDITLIWVFANLKGSLYPFVLVFVLFLLMLERLVSQLQSAATIEQLSQTEYLADLCTSLFFGIGVIWTAIGMRSALLAGLGGLDSAAAAEVGAFAILQRLVDGGILLALSTTIVGGIGGYLMRVYKSLRVGAKLRHRYVQEAKSSEQAVLDRLDVLNANLIRMIDQQNTASESITKTRDS